MNKLLEKIDKINKYSLVLKILGFGFQIIGITLIIFVKNYNIWIAISGMCFGIIFLAFGELINLLDKISRKKME